MGVHGNDALADDHDIGADLVGAPQLGHCRGSRMVVRLEHVRGPGPHV